jgi:hypothetical protein
MKTRLVAAIAALTLIAFVALVQEYDEPATSTTLSTSTVVTETITGYRTVLETSVPVRVNGVTEASVTSITTCKLVTMKTYSNGQLVSEKRNVERQVANTYPWLMARTNASGEVIAPTIRPGAAAVWWRAWKNSIPTE